MDAIKVFVKESLFPGSQKDVKSVLDIMYFQMNLVCWDKIFFPEIINEPIQSLESM